MEYKKYLSNAKKSIIAMLGIWLVLNLFGIFTTNATIIMFVALGSFAQMFLINPSLLAYSGYVAVKVGKGDDNDAAYSGATAGLVAGAVMLVLSLALGTLIMGQLGSSGEGLTLLFLGVGALSGLVSLFLFVAGGFIFGELGAYVARRGGKKEAPKTG